MCAMLLYGNLVRVTLLLSLLLMLLLLLPHYYFDPRPCPLVRSPRL